ncbi:hypothetical protein HKBW3S03_01978, partial [Candidatus Hakubella thermalkaliphila]
HLDSEGEYRSERKWQGLRQVFRWVNGIEDDYLSGKHNILTIQLVMCEESWEEVDKKGCTVMKTSRHAWISSDPINRKNVHERCNLATRKRWLHENNILKEKHQVYRYGHIFSHDWNALRGDHYLMQIGRMLNEMVLHSISLAEHLKEVEIQSFIRKFFLAMTQRSLATERIRQRVKSPCQLRLVLEEDWQTSRQLA